MSWQLTIPTHCANQMSKEQLDTAQTTLNQALRWVLPEPPTLPRLQVQDQVYIYVTVAWLSTDLFELRRALELVRVLLYSIQTDELPGLAEASVLLTVCGMHNRVAQTTFSLPKASLAA